MNLTDIKQQRWNDISLKLPTKPSSPVQTTMRFNLIFSSIIALVAVTLAAATPVAQTKGSLDLRVTGSIVKCVDEGCEQDDAPGW
ncbi:hypothetical protein FB45DRAFT_1060922 [Roridomyces roridus]|uniref:Uncharacterized protein n=1 Tax=Roridomyces roridus TaxID=1738132 RepID=A0AAD7BLV7_9AGAR|nr:hypothetical protein FB45DRAFT_1060922 [Roridomyces roridus]